MIKKILLIALFSACLAVKADNAPFKFYSDSVASVGVVVYDLKADKQVLNYNGEKTFVPASTLKLVTSAAAISLYPIDFQYETPAYIDGKIIDGTVYGDIIIKGVGDPTIKSRHFPDNQTFVDDITSALTEKGVKNFTGNIIVDTGDQKNQGKLGSWEIEDGYYEYGTGWYAFNYSDNVLHLNPASMDAQELVSIEDIASIVDGNLYLTQSFGASYNEIDDTETFEDNQTLVIPNPYPGSMLISELYAKFSEVGINLVYDEDYVENPEEETDSIPLASYYSPALKAILTDLMHRSDNMMAESTLRLLAPGKSLKEALKAEKDFYELKGISTELMTIKDGSGLSRTDAVSPKFMVEVLKMMSGNADFIDIFPRAGVNGTLKNTFKGSKLEGLAALKSGSMGGVRCYAGYLLDENENPAYAVSIMVNNYKCPLRELHKAIETFLEKYYE